MAAIAASFKVAAVCNFHPTDQFSHIRRTSGHFRLSPLSIQTGAEISVAVAEREARLPFIGETPLR